MVFVNWFQLYLLFFCWIYTKKNVFDFGTIRTYELFQRFKTKNTGRFPQISEDSLRDEKSWPRNQRILRFVRNSKITPIGEGGRAGGPYALLVRGRCYVVPVVAILTNCITTTRAIAWTFGKDYYGFYRIISIFIVSRPRWPRWSEPARGDRPYDYHPYRVIRGTYIITVHRINTLVVYSKIWTGSIKFNVPLVDLLANVLRLLSRVTVYMFIIICGNGMSLNRSWRQLVLYTLTSERFLLNS